jgi:hypothetical protein
MTRRLAAIVSALLVCLWALPSSAQEPVATDPPAHISVVDGSAVLERDGRTDADVLSMPLLAGDRVRTQAGRVEVLFADGSTLHLDEHTLVDFQSDEVVRLLGGRVRLNVTGQSREVAYRIDAPSAWVQISNPGEYRVALLRGDEVELAVLRGSAELVNEQGRSAVAAGERTYARAQAAPSPAYVFNSAAWDSFDRWSEARRDQRLGVSAQYLPDDVQPYAPTFATYGTWRQEPAYGYVWYPRVQAGWRPYHHGRWVSLRPYGWTWVGGDPWGWPTHHYGRWGFTAGNWFWIPGRSWAPAWVSWAYAPGYVSWCPLGWNSRPVFGFSASYYGGRRYDPWVAWSVLPRHHFTSAYVNVSRYPLVRVDPRLHNAFVINRRGPDVNFAINRSAVPIRTAGRSAAWRNDGGARNSSSDGGPRGVSSDGGGARSSSDGGGARSSGDGGGARLSSDSAGGRDGERGFPSAARTPGSPISNVPQNRVGARTRPESRGVARETDAQSRAADGPAPAASDPRAAARSDASPDSRAGAPRGVRRSDAPTGAVTAAPSGAVRAVPRMRSRDSDPAAPTGTREVRPYSSSPRYESPAVAPPSNPQPRYRTPEPRADGPQNRPIERSGPREPAYRGGVERNGGGGERHGGYAPRSHGGGSDRQAPAAAPRSAPPAPRGGGDGGSGGRQGSGERQGTGQATSRRR